MLIEPKTEYGSTTIESLKDPSSDYSSDKDDKCCNQKWKIYFAAISGMYISISYYGIDTVPYQNILMPERVPYFNE